MMIKDSDSDQVEWAHHGSWWITVRIGPDTSDINIVIPPDMPTHITDAAKLWANSPFMYEMDLQEFIDRTVLIE
jgi:hypothetical protein